MFRILLVTFALTALAGCKLLVMVPDGGYVESASSGSCPALSVCSHEVSDSTFIETFTAVPHAGFTFTKWNNGDYMLCQDSTNPTCVVDTTVLAGIVPDEVIANLGQAYILPIFSKELPDEEKEFVTIGDKQWWAQLGLFSGLSWNDINAVCPADSGGVCTGNLNGYDVTGWVWAAPDDVISLFNEIAGATLVTMVPANYWEADAPWATSIFEAGFHYTDTNFYEDIIEGITRGTGLDNSVLSAVHTRWRSQHQQGFAGEIILSYRPLDFTFGGKGAWLYRTAP